MNDKLTESIKKFLENFRKIYKDVKIIAVVNSKDNSVLFIHNNKEIELVPYYYDTIETLERDYFYSNRFYDVKTIFEEDKYMAAIGYKDVAYNVDIVYV